MAGVYTERFMLTTGEGVQATYEVPEDKRAIVTNVLCQTSSPAGGGFHLYVHGYYLWTYTAPVAYGHDTFATRMVVYERETFVVVTFGTGVSVGMFGYLFDDHVGRPPALEPTVEGPGPGPGPYSEIPYVG